MKIRSLLPLAALLTCSASILLSLPSSGATISNSSFTGTSLDAILTRTSTGTGAGVLTLSGGANGTAVFSTARNYVGTVDTDYAIANFDWTASIEVQHTNFASNQLFFGLGTGTTPTNAGANPYGEPQGATANEAANFISMPDLGNARSLITINKASSEAYFANQVDFSDGQFDALLGTTGGVANGAFYKYYLDFNHLTEELTFSISTLSGFGGTAGPKGLVRTVDVTGDGYNGSNGRIFFGGNGSTFDNFSVVPEPATGLIGALGAGILLMRRKRNRPEMA